MPSGFYLGHLHPLGQQNSKARSSLSPPACDRSEGADLTIQRIILLVGLVLVARMARMGSECGGME